jgi:septal ring factor EnvC (AmiA/AmiB activator)
MVGDLEHDLDRTEEKFKKTKTELSLTEGKLNVLENLIAEQVKKINILRDNHQSMISQISKEDIKHLKDVNEEKEI